jgi:hypothetical protein
VQGDPIVAEQNFATGFGMSGIGIVKKGWAKKARAEDSHPEQKEYGESNWCALNVGECHAAKRLRDRRNALRLSFLSMHRKSVSCDCKGILERMK